MGAPARLIVSGVAPNSPAHFASTEPGAHARVLAIQRVWVGGLALDRETMWSAIIAECKPSRSPSRARARMPRSDRLSERNIPKNHPGGSFPQSPGLRWLWPHLNVIGAALGRGQYSSRRRRDESRYPRPAETVGLRIFTREVEVY